MILQISCHASKLALMTMVIFFISKAEIPEFKRLSKMKARIGMGIVSILQNPNLTSGIYLHSVPKDYFIFFIE